MNYTDLILYYPSDLIGNLKTHLDLVSVMRNHMKQINENQHICGTEFFLTQ